MSTTIPSGMGASVAQSGSQSAVSQQSSKTNNASGDMKSDKKENHTIGSQQVGLTVHHINQKLATSNLKLEFAADQPPGSIWLNVVDGDSGKVIQKLPPDSVRKLSESQSLKGLQIDKQR